MSNPFDILPPNLFNVFTSVGYASLQRHYMAILIRIYSLAEFNRFGLARETVIAEIVDYIKESDAEGEVKADMANQTDPEADSVSMTGSKPEQTYVAYLIRRYVERATKQMEVSDLLRLQFDDYTQTLGPAYHALKTSDHVSRYRRDIINQIQEWLVDDDWLAHTAEELATQSRLTPAQAEHETNQSLLFIVHQLDGLDPLIADIDARHAQYLRTSFRQIRYKLGNADGSFKDKLVSLAQHLSSLRTEGLEDIPETEHAPRNTQYATLSIPSPPSAKPTPANKPSSPKKSSPSAKRPPTSKTKSANSAQAIAKRQSKSKCLIPPACVKLALPFLTG